MSAPVRFPRFFVTSPMPCPYLPGRTERKVFTELKGDNSAELNDALSRIGFRRSQTVAYRPSCLGCTACVSVRVVASEFDASSSQRRTMVEYREPNADGTPGRLVGACLTDHQGDGLSMVYSFYDPHHPTRAGLGTYIILDHIRRASQLGLPYVYLGYWVEGSACMQYKVRFRPMERLGPDGWTRLAPAEQADAIDRVATGRRRDALVAATSG